MALMVYVLTVVLLGVCSAPHAARAAEGGYFVIAHMANTRAAIDWAIQQGANAIEVDLNFRDGKATRFRHGFPCDCTGGLLCRQVGDSICKFGASCAGSMEAVELLQYVANQLQVALLVIDSKVRRYGRTLSRPEQRSAAQHLVELLESELFGRGYTGSVIISVARVDGSRSFMRTAATAAASKPFADKVYFSYDQEGNDVERVLDTLVRSVRTKGRAFGTGRSACLPGDFRKGIDLARRNREAGVASFVYVWTVDQGDSMERYLKAGAQGIMTNFPGRLKQLIEKRGGTLATRETPLPLATSDRVINDPAGGESGLQSR
jgi:glycerophosphoryl diester phosphodiesterase